MNKVAASLHWGAESPLEIAAALLLAAVYLGSVFAAWRRLGGTARWIGVAALNAAACLAIFALLAPPALLRPPSDAIALLTEGAPAAPDAATIAYVAPGAGDYGRAPGYLLDIGQLPLREPALGALSVTGHGLESFEWQRLPDDLAIRYDPPPLSGVIEAAWQRSLAEGEALIVTGRYLDNPSASAAVLELLDPAGIAVATHDLLSGETFELTTQPRAPGLLEYRLRVRGNDRELHSEPVPVFVRSGERPRLYVMQSAPSFETRALQNWAGDSGATVVIDTVITRGRELRQRVNTGMPGPLDDKGLSPALLESIGLAIVDGRTWAGLDTMRRAWFEAAVREGMGLLVLADGELADYLGGNDALLQGFGLARQGRDRDGYAPAWQGAVAQQPLPLLGFALEYRDGAALTRIESGEVVEAYRNVGLGRVAVSVMRERHRWLTSGDETSYTAYWAQLLGRIARPAAPPFLLPELDDPWPRPHRRMRVCAMVVSSEVSFDIAPLRDPSRLQLDSAVPSTGGSRRCAEFWPWQAGWHHARLIADGTGEPVSEAYYYVFGDDEWRTHWRHARQQASLLRASSVDAERAAMTRTVRVDIEPLWPWFVFIVSAGLLWLERRLF